MADWWQTVVSALHLLHMCEVKPTQAAPLWLSSHVCIFRTDERMCHQPWNVLKPKETCEVLGITRANKLICNKLQAFFGLVWRNLRAISQSQSTVHLFALFLSRELVTRLRPGMQKAHTRCIDHWDTGWIGSSRPGAEVFSPPDSSGLGENLEQSQKVKEFKRY